MPRSSVGHARLLLQVEGSSILGQDQGFQLSCNCCSWLGFGWRSLTPTTGAHQEAGLWLQGRSQLSQVLTCSTAPRAAQALPVLLASFPSLPHKALALQCQATELLGSSCAELGRQPALLP